VDEAFYAAMKSGVTAGAMRQIAPDAVFVEGGKLETRAEYEANHLPADVEFERQVSEKRGVAGDLRGEHCTGDRDPRVRASRSTARL